MTGPIFFVTCFKLSVDPEGVARKRQRTWGWFVEFDDAEKAVLTNEADIYEQGYYDVALIEAVPQGLMPILMPEGISERWYRASFDTDGNMVEVVKTTKPAAFKNIVSFSVG